MTENIGNTLTTQKVATTKLNVPDIPQTGDFDAATLRTILTAIKDRLAQMDGDGPNAVLTLQRAVDTGLLEVKPPSSGGHAQLSINPYTGYGGVTFSGVRVPPPARRLDGKPGDVQSLTAYASGSGGVYLTWAAPARSGGVFDIYRGVRNKRSQAEYIHTTSSLAYFDATAAVHAIGDGSAAGPKYFYWVVNRVKHGDATVAEGEWSGGETGGVEWAVNPATHTMIVADNILAGRLNVVLDLNVNGVLRSGKEAADDTASGFFIDGNTFYFGSADDGSYIRWNGTTLQLSGDLYSANIYGGLIEGSTLAGNYIFVRDMVYDSAADAPEDGLYQSAYAAESGELYNVGCLVRNEVLLTNDYASDSIAFNATVEAAPRTGVYVECQSSTSDGDTILPYDFIREHVTNREAVEGTLQLVVEVTITPDWSWYRESGNPISNLAGYAGAPYCAEFVLQRHFIEYDENGDVSGDEDRTTTFNLSSGTNSFPRAANDPLGTGSHTYTDNGGFFNPYYINQGGTFSLADDMEVVVDQAQYTTSIGGKRHLNGAVVNRVIIPITDNDKHMQSWKVGLRMQSDVLLKVFGSVDPTLKIRAWFQVDNSA